MKPEARAHLDAARFTLVKAKAGVQASTHEPSLAENAARDAYYVAFHAALALIVERTGKEPKRHASVQRQFHQLTRHDLAIPQSMRDFILRAYDFKTVADYATLPPPRITPARAAKAVQSAEQVSHHRSRVATPLNRAGGWIPRVGSWASLAEPTRRSTIAAIETGR